MLSSDIIKPLVKTAKNTTLKTNLKSIRFGMYSKKSWTGYGVRWYLISYRLGSGGGYIASFLFRRRVKIMFKVVLQTCYLYLSQEHNEDNKRKINEIIGKVLTHQRMLMTKQKGEFGISERLSAGLKLASSILSIPFIVALLKHPSIEKTADNLINQTNITNLSNQTNIAESINQISTSPLLFILVLTVIEVLLILFLWLIPKYAWYRRIMKMCGVSSKEIKVYDSLIPLQKFILANGFPTIREVLDET